MEWTNPTSVKQTLTLAYYFREKNTNHHKRRHHGKIKLVWNSYLVCHPGCHTIGTRTFWWNNNGTCLSTHGESSPTFHRINNVELRIIYGGSEINHQNLHVTLGADTANDFHGTVSDD